MATHITTPIYVSSPRNKLKKRRIRNGHCAAAVRAVTAAKLYRDGSLAWPLRRSAAAPVARMSKPRSSCSEART